MYFTPQNCPKVLRNPKNHTRFSFGTFKKKDRERHPKTPREGRKNLEKLAVGKVRGPGNHGPNGVKKGPFGGNFSQRKVVGGPLFYFKGKFENWWNLAGFGLQ